MTIEESEMTRHAYGLGQSGKTEQEALGYMRDAYGDASDVVLGRAIRTAYDSLARAGDARTGGHDFLGDVPGLKDVQGLLRVRMFYESSSGGIRNRGVMDILAPTSATLPGLLAYARSWVEDQRLRGSIRSDPEDVVDATDETIVSIQSIQLPAGQFSAAKETRLGA